MSIFQMKHSLPYSEYVLFQKYFNAYGIGQEVEYIRSANLMNTIMNYITGAMGGKPQNLTAEDIYPQLSYTDAGRKGKRPGCLIDWSKTPERVKRQLIKEGLYNEDGDPVGYNPHGSNGNAR